MSKIFLYRMKIITIMNIPYMYIMCRPIDISLTFLSLLKRGIHFTCNGNSKPNFHFYRENEVISFIFIFFTCLAFLYQKGDKNKNKREGKKNHLLCFLLFPYYSICPRQEQFDLQSLQQMG